MRRDRLDAASDRRAENFPRRAAVRPSGQHGDGLRVLPVEDDLAGGPGRPLPDAVELAAGDGAWFRAGDRGPLSLFAWRWRTQFPWVAVGWCWFVGTLVPVIGLVQVGEQAMADRYTYLPLIGVFLALTWGVEAATVARRGCDLAERSGRTNLAAQIRERLELYEAGRPWRDLR